MEAGPSCLYYWCPGAPEEGSGPPENIVITEMGHIMSSLVDGGMLHTIGAPTTHRTKLDS